MPIFIYKAKSSTGEEKVGSREAASQTDLARLLRQDGFFLISANILGQEKKKSQFNWGFLESLLPISLVEKMLFARYLAVMVKAGLPLNQALEILSKQTKNKRFAKIIGEVNKDIQRGVAFSDSLAKYPNVFSDLFVNMVRVGESGGNLEEILKLLAIQMDKDHQLVSKVKGALVYPSVIFVAMIGVGIIMMVVIVPKITATFQELKIELPISTQIIIGLSNFLSKHIWWSIGIVVAAVILVTQFLKTKVGKRGYDWLGLNLPVLSTTIPQINSARLARNLSALIEGGVPITKSLQILSAILTNSYYRESLVEATREIQKGHLLSDTLSKYPLLYPPLIIQMMEVGERTGTLGQILEELADFYEEEVGNFTKNLTNIIEPVLMVIIGAAVGFFAISMIQPMYTMMSAI